jgi:hypothetical protein
VRPATESARCILAHTLQTPRLEAVMRRQRRVAVSRVTAPLLLKACAPRVGHWLEGTVAEQLVRSAHCPVLIARSKDHAGAPKTGLPDAPYAGGEP